MANQISSREKKIAAALLVFFTALPAVLIIWFWPDRLPQPKEFVKPLYCPKPFHVTLAGISDTMSFEAAMNADIERKKKETADVPTTNASNNVTNPGSNNTAASNTITNTTSGDTGTTNNTGKTVAPKPVIASIANTENQNKPDSICGCQVVSVPNSKYIAVKDESRFLHINTILLILVAMAGFLGNMIHIATSLTTFVGNNQFVRSWLLWYVVRPFTGAALAVGVYFVFRGGFLNMSDDSTNINLYGIMTVSVLTGLFTDRATQKLKEVFETLFKPKEDRNNPLDGKPKIAGVSPLAIIAGIENPITLTGENLTASTLTATINDEPVTLVDITDKSATIKYTIPETQKDKTSFNLVIKDEEGKAVPGGTITLTLKQEEETGDGNNSGAVNDETGDDDTDTTTNEQGAQE